MFTMKIIKYNFVLLCILLICSTDKNVYSQICPTFNASCPVVGEPSVDDCIAGIQKYLSRSMAMGLANTIDIFAIDGCENACDLPYEDCPNGNYCPTRYCEDIEVLVDLNIAFIRRAATVYGKEYQMDPNHPFYNGLEQVVLDINNAYDCAGLRRPIIQAAILERITPDVNFVEIPDYVKSDFNLDPDFDSSFYNNITHFNSSRIVYTTSGSDTGYPDINRIETRMWFYYLATQFIDLGYTALHMGWFEVMTANDPSYVQTYYLYKKIREYAAANQTFVILDAHVRETIKYGGQMLLDFNSAPVRPIEVSNNIMGTNCANDFLTDIIPAEGDIYDNSTGGISPRGCNYINTPYFVEWDHHSPVCGVEGTSHPGSWCVWGYDEINYYFNLSEGCQADVLDAFSQKVRTIDHHGFLQFPGKFAAGVWGDGRTIFRLHDFPDLREEIRDILAPSPNMEINVMPKEFMHVSKGVTQIIQSFILTAINTDNTSYLTWHIQKPDGSWLNYSEGTSRVLFPNQLGNYTITLRQDNFGLQPNASGTNEITQTITVNSLSRYQSEQIGNIDSELMKSLENELDEHLVDRTEVSYKSKDLGNSTNHSPLVYPNPVKNDIVNIELPFLSFNHDKPVLVELKDINGKVFTSKEFIIDSKLLNIDVNNVPGGVYLVSIQSDKQNWIEKILIIK